MNTKQKGDIGEINVMLAALKRGWGVSSPIGDRLAYDLIFDIGGRLFKIQVKTAWLNEKTNAYVVDVRRTKTNRRVMKRAKYLNEDFDFAIIFIDVLNVFYVMPSEVFNKVSSNIYFVEGLKRQRKPASYIYREAWDLFLSK